MEYRKLGGEITPAWERLGQGNGGDVSLSNCYYSILRHHSLHLKPRPGELGRHPFGDLWPGWEEKN